MNVPIKKTAAEMGHPTGCELLHNPRLNKGTAFTEVERRAWGLEGLLPASATNIELQVSRRHAEIAALDNDLQKYLELADLLARNETLYYIACAGVPPQGCLPVVLDFGTNNQALLDDSFYLGLRQHRVRGEDYLAFVDEFVEAVQQLYPKCCIQ